MEDKDNDQEARFSELQRQIEELKAIVAKKTENEAREIDAILEDKLSAILAQIKSEDSVLSRIPTFALACRPTERVEIRGIFGGYRQEVIKLFDEPPQLREGGFDLATSGRSSINVGGDYRLMKIPGYQARFVSREGVCGLLAPGTEDFIGWALSGTPGVIRFNPIALAEITYV